MTRLEELIRNTLDERALHGQIVRRPQGDARAPLLDARVNHGRWIVDCPWCSGATILIDEDPRFFCCDCCNTGADHRYLPVRVRPDREVVERLLMRRPRMENRNCRPDETPDDLMRENTAHGIY